MAAPESTYGADPAGSTRDLVRLLSGDTGREAEFWLADTEIDWIIADRLIDGVPRPYLSAADVLDEMAVRAAQRSDTRVVGGVQDSNRTDALYSKFSILAEKRRSQSVSRDPGDATVVVVGGAADECHPRYFYVNQFNDRSIYP